MPENILIEKNGLTWHHFDDADDPELIVLAAQYGLHDLAIEDCLSASVRPKLDDYDTHVFVVLNAPSFSSNPDRLLEQKFCIFTGPDFVVTVGDGASKPIGHAINGSKLKKLNDSPAGVLYLIMDNVCDQYLPTIDAISDEISELEMRAYEKPEQSISRQATNMKKILTQLRRGATAHRELIGQLLRKHPPVVDAKLNLYFRDIYDHLVQSTDLIETDRDLLSGIIDVNLSATTHRTNEIVKTLTIYATVLLPLNVVTGYFGMNIPNLPLEDIQHSAFIVTLAMILMVGGTAYYFQKKQW